MNGTLVMTDGEVSLDPHPSESSLPVSPIFLNDLATKKYEILPAGEYYICLVPKLKIFPVNVNIIRQPPEMAHFHLRARLAFYLRFTFTTKGTETRNSYAHMIISTF